MLEIQLRNEIVSIISIADARILSVVHAMLKSYYESEPEIVGFTPDGKPISKTELFYMVEKSRKEGLQGKVRSLDDALAEIKNW